MLTTTYYNIFETIPATGMGNPYLEGKERLVNHHEKFYTIEDAKEFMDIKRESWISYLQGELESETDPKLKEHHQKLIDGTTYEIKEEVVEYTHATEHLWSDCIAYEIVKVVSQNTLEIRRMHSDLFIDGNTIYESDDKQDVIRIRRKRNNPEVWGYKRLRFTLGTKPYAYRDPHF